MPAADPYVATQPSVAQVFTEGYMSGEDLLNYPDIFESIFPFLQEEKTIVDFMQNLFQVKPHQVQNHYAQLII